MPTLTRCLVEVDSRTDALKAISLSVTLNGILDELSIDYLIEIMLKTPSAEQVDYISKILLGISNKQSQHLIPYLS
jgi:hypothetical protein